MKKIYPDETKYIKDQKELNKLSILINKKGTNPKVKTEAKKVINIIEKSINEYTELKSKFLVNKRSLNDFTKEYNKISFQNGIFKFEGTHQEIKDKIAEIIKQSKPAISKADLDGEVKKIFAKHQSFLKYLDDKKESCYW